jgi:hypothetical protein
VEDWGVFAWISARWTEVVTRALFGCARWTSDRCSDFLESAEQHERERSRLSIYQVSLSMISNRCISDLHIQLAPIAYSSSRK